MTNLFISQQLHRHQLQLLQLLLLLQLVVGGDDIRSRALEAVVAVEVVVHRNDDTYEAFAHTYSELHNKDKPVRSREQPLQVHKQQLHEVFLAPLLEHTMQ